MSEHILLPTCTPFYCTYHYQGGPGIVVAENPTMRNWFLNECMLLSCKRRFLRGYTSPEVSMWNCNHIAMPNIRKAPMNTRFLTNYIPCLIKETLRAGWYIEFNGVDDYYVEGKSWYNEKHFPHDGLLCGFDDTDETYYIAAYDKSWIYRVFKTPQKAFYRGLSAMFEQDWYGDFLGMKVDLSAAVKLDPGKIRENVREYLSYGFSDYPPEEEGRAYGLLVHEYIRMYLARLLDGSVPYEKTDRRVFRMVWEQKNCMLERIRAVEAALGRPPDISRRFEGIVSACNRIRMLYARHLIRRSDALLRVIDEILKEITVSERILLEELIQLLEKEGF